MPHFENLKLPELKAIVLQQLNIPLEVIRTHGDLRLRATWLSAIASATNSDAISTCGQNDQKLETTEKDENSTCGHFVHKFTAIQNAIAPLATCSQNDHKLSNRPKPAITSVIFGAKSEFACPIGHPMMRGGKLQELPDGWDYFGYSDQGFPQGLIDEDTGILYPFEGFKTLPLTLGQRHYSYCQRVRFPIFREVC